ncbi:hypothetical protein [Methylocapsa sp. S129]|uniref:hypothetical protein n=1 Tax=Methylocapsa sp. S129 TaxID=1641869 RepID=UPI00131CE3C8|nr:hypothetical protein [Methylocapsa sp. S129]
MPRQRFIQDFAQAVVKHGGDHVVLALIRGALGEAAIVSLAGGTSLFIYHSTFIATGLIVSTDHGSTGTGTGTGGPTGTGGGGTRFGTDPHETDPGTDLGTEDGTDDFVSAPLVGMYGWERASVEALVDYANQLRAAGALDVGSDD